MRSLLTMLGIIIGIASIMAIVSIIKGTNDKIKENLIGSGRNTVNINLSQNGQVNDYYYDSQTTANVPPVAQDAIDQILSLKEVENVTAYLSAYPGDGVFYGAEGNSSVLIHGIDLRYLDTAGYAVRYGRGFNADDYQNYRSVILIHQSLATSLFGQKDPLGKSLEISSIPFTVVGVLSDQKERKTNITSVDDYYSSQDEGSVKLFIPKSSWPLLFSYDMAENVILKAVNTDSMTRAGQKAAQILNTYLPSSSAANSSKYVAEDLQKTTKDQQDLENSTNRLLFGIALISLLVGGIGVMNIMLVSVTERVSEIGLKKAIGAPKSAILAQFLTEAAVLTSMGGVLGVIAGIIVSQVMHRVMEIETGIDVTFSIIAVAVSMGIGLIFGFVPSVRAANLDPIEALRRE